MFHSLYIQTLILAGTGKPLLEHACTKINYSGTAERLWSLEALNDYNCNIIMTAVYLFMGSVQFLGRYRICIRKEKDDLTENHPKFNSYH